MLSKVIATGACAVSLVATATGSEAVPVHKPSAEAVAAMKAANKAVSAMKASQSRKRMLAKTKANAKTGNQKKSSVFGKLAKKTAQGKRRLVTTALEECDRIPTGEGEQSSSSDSGDSGSSSEPAEPPACTVAQLDGLWDNFGWEQEHGSSYKVSRLCLLLSQ
jgi:hypothetical protein